MSMGEDVGKKFEFSGDDLETIIFESLGAASVCWENPDGAGVFDSTRAKEIGDAVLKEIKRLMGDVYYLQRKVQNQSAMLKRLEEARGGVTPVEHWKTFSASPEVRVIEWDGVKWVREDCYNEQVKQRSDMAERLSACYSENSAWYYKKRVKGCE